MCVGVNIAPRRGKDNETYNGFTIGERVKIKEGIHFWGGWHGHIHAFEPNIIAINLDEPPIGHAPNGQWFNYNDLEKAPK